MLFIVVVCEMGSHCVLMLATPPSREPFHPTAANSRKCPEQVTSPRVPSTFKFPSWPHPDLEATQIKNSHSSLLADGEFSFSLAHYKQRLLLVSVSGCETQPSGTQELSHLRGATELSSASAWCLPTRLLYCSVSRFL